MSTNTPRPRTSGMRQSMGTSTTANMHRKASYNALVGSPSTPRNQTTSDAFAAFAVGDVVNVPGDMYGTVKFIGSVKGKAGRFLGVELSGDYAMRGKNNGDVDGTSYFRTSVPGAGIFLPLHRAQLRSPPTTSGEDQESSPDTPTANSFLAKRKQTTSPGTPSVPRFAQTVGPGARPPSPQFKPTSRQSLPRPESPLRRLPNLQPASQATPGRQFSQSVRPGVRPPSTPSAAARSATPKLSASVRGGAPPVVRPYSRTGSRLGSRSESVSEASNPARSPSRLTRTNDEVLELQTQLADKDKQLAEQAAQLVEMEATLKEIQAFLPSDHPRSPRKESGDPMQDSMDSDVSTLRQALQEKNDKISSLVTEFDTHRSDFRSTIETLELASDETVRMYEARISELVSEIGELRDSSPAQRDVETIAGQLKMLEELVAELEDGLEDARRGEAEARGEVEFLRGEVERGRSELRREREKAASSTPSSIPEEPKSSDRDMERELEMKDDEIRGLKAILHSNESKMQGEERPLPLNVVRNGTKSSGNDEQQGLNPSQIRCEGCDVPGHDLLHCPMFGRVNGGGSTAYDVSPMTGADESPMPQQGEAEKWCALCEQDGHLAFDCPTEQY